MPEPQDPVHWNGAGPVVELASNTLGLILDAAPWLLFGLILAGLIKAFVPLEVMERWLGGRGLWAVTKAAIVGAPLPLCSCGVIPAALGLRRAGASREATLSFLIATPETGVDSVAITYALMGPFMTVIRPLAAVLSAITVGLASGVAELIAPARAATGPSPLHPRPDCGCSQAETTCCATSPGPASTPDRSGALGAGLRYAFVDLYDEIFLWMAVGLLLAGAVLTLVPDSALVGLGSGLGAKLAVLVVGIPMYICATASTPVAASLLLAGVSPGTVLVFLLAGPATNIATLGIVRREFGLPVFGIYLVGMAAVSILLGVLTDHLAESFQVDAHTQISQSAQLIPLWFQSLSALFLLVLGIRPLRDRLLSRLPA